MTLHANEDNYIQELSLLVPHMHGIKEGTVVF